MEYRKLDYELVEDRESGDWGEDPVSGAFVTRLTSTPCWSHNIYCEQPYTDPSGKRVLIGRAYDFFSRSRQLLICDLETLCMFLVEPDVPTELVAHSSWSEWAYYVMHNGALRRVSLESLEKEEVLPAGSVTPPPKAHLLTISPDDRCIIGYEYRDDGGHDTFALHLPSGEHQVLYDASDNLNPHAQVDPGDSGKWLYQLIRKESTTRIPVFVDSLSGGEAVQLPFGDPWSAESSGHMSWIGMTGSVVCAMDWNREERCHDERHPEGNVLYAAPGDETARVIEAPGHALYHVSASKCGRYFVGDDFMDFKADAFRKAGPGPIRIVVGCFETGRTKVLIEDCQMYNIAGSSRFEPDPYFTADNGYVIYNGAPYGINHVFAAKVPDGFLASIA